MNDDGRTQRIPLFPLGTVLFPGGPLPLRIFEARYLDMVGECMRAQSPFGVCLITDGREAGLPAQTVAIGTLAEIVDWDRQDDGLLGITGRGSRRFRIIDTQVQPNRLVRADVLLLPEESSVPVPAAHADLAALAQALVRHSGPLYKHTPEAFDDAGWVGYRLSEILPLPMSRRQALLEMDDASARLDELAELVSTLARSATSQQG